MAGVADVFTALGALIEGVIYPNGIGQPSSILVNGVAQPVRIFAGWPIPANLDNDLAAGTSTVSIYAPKGFWRNTTRYPTQDWIQQTVPITTISVFVAPNQTQVTFAGSPSPGVVQNVSVLSNGVAATLTVANNDTPTTIAATLTASLVAQGVTCTSTGPTITIPGAVKLAARVGGTATAIREVMRQEQQFTVTCWSPAPPATVPIPDAIRTALSEPIKVALAAQNFLTLIDDTAARLIIANDYLDDDVQKPNCYKHTFVCQIEYATTQTETESEIVLMAINLSAGVQGAEAPIGTFNY